MNSQLTTVFAQYTPKGIYQERKITFENSLVFIQDTSKKEKVKQADEMLYEINQKICNRFEEDINKLAAIMEEFRTRKNITETRVAYGQVDTPVEQADYWVNFAAEAIAYQRVQDYTPQFNSESGARAALTYSVNDVKGDLGVLRGKVERAKNEVVKVLNE